MSIDIDKAGAAREGEVPDIKILNEYLSANASQLSSILEITQFPSGYSNLTFCLKTNNAEYILRRPPIGANIKSAHDMGREFTVLSKLKKHYSKVPTPIVYCETDEIIGAPFYIMERLKGVILRSANAPKLFILPDVYRKTSEALVDNLVELHGLDIRATGLDQLGKPEGYVQRQVEGWIKRYYTAETDSLEHMNTLAEWLPKNMPGEQAPVFLHNDYKYDNVVLHPQDLSKIIGVLDWEMSTVGDPLMDLGACLAYWSEAGDDPILQSFNLTALPGNISRQEFASLYALKSNRNLSDILFYYLFGIFKNAVIAQQIYARWKQGFSKDPRFGGLIMVIKSLAKHGVESLEKQKL
jgi:aminoglycoside phosphotransferase (APT) family kinase protein